MKAPCFCGLFLIAKIQLPVSPVLKAEEKPSWCVFEITILSELDFTAYVGPNMCLSHL